MPGRFRGRSQTKLHPTLFCGSGKFLASKNLTFSRPSLFSFLLPPSPWCLSPFHKLYSLFSVSLGERRVYFYRILFALLLFREVCCGLLKTFHLSLGPILLSIMLRIQPFLLSPFHKIYCFFPRPQGLHRVSQCVSLTTGSSPCGANGKPDRGRDSEYWGKLGRLPRGPSSGPTRAFDPYLEGKTHPTLVLG